MTKRCRRCDLVKAIAEFYSGKSRCKECMRALARDAYNSQTPAQKAATIDRQLKYEATPAGRATNRRARLKMRYGISEDQYNWLLEQQDHKCFLCGEDETLIHHSTGKLRALSVDHDHRCCSGNKACGRCVRGLLCYNCNRFMGRVDKSPCLSERFKDYQDRRPLNPRCPECWSNSVMIPMQYGQPAFECSRGHKWVQPQNYVAEFREDLRTDVY